MENQELTNKEREIADDKLITGAFEQLLQIYIDSPHRKKVDIITKAFNFARQAHKGVRRLSGEPYIMHPIAVARIACEEMGLGSTSISAALLHDVVEDTDYTVEDIENIFGSKIAMIVDGLTKISGGIFGDKASAQAENFKKLLLTMSDDIRVILIKICDRLHNMRTLQSQAPNKQYKIAGETLYIYAPLANRLGLNKIKTELEDLSFRYEHPDKYEDIRKKLSLSEEERNKLFADFTAPIRESLDSMGIQYEIKARVKSPYSIWNKMQNKHVTFDEIYDILAVRIIFTPQVRANEIYECFNIYVALSKIYKSHPDRLRDWLNHPKANGYQALHVTLMSKQGRWIEVQIRSDRMNEIAEQGFAAHWKYKEGDQPHEDEGELNDWLRTIKEILDDPQPDAMDFLDAIKLNLFASEIFVFTPKGEVKTMPANCTVLDFAFQIHTFLGSHCIGAKVNHKLVPLSHKLKSGDQVEVLTSKSQHVQPSWITFASTAKAKAKIQAILRRDNRELQKKGEDTLKQWLEKNETELTTSVVEKLCEFHEIQKAEDFFLALGERTILLGEKDLNELHGKSQKSGAETSGWRKFVPFLGKGKKKEENPQTKKLVVGKDFNKKKPCIISEKSIGMYIIPTCCHAIPGDDILGYIDNKNQIELHQRACPVANRLKSSFGNRILDAKWDMHKVLFFDATIQIRGIDRKGMLHDISDVITEKLDVNIHRVTISADDGIYDGKIEIRVHDRAEVQEIVDALKQIEDMQEVIQI
ncbi:bifunctional (p)ppGpp synthetase/guanosine-3',5'-bis(diphosphate) 3'-pyrophosphohydrolase [Prevotella sp. P3-122]|uniref:RelA/SpoT family protein n=1 Tax=Prevotella sp. P3-122 TaxID=2024223 RepID=UPI000B97433C|nr:RelA/SpoT family protein [Prevotella sp. P3-122]MCI6310223.1 RelA/SpoT family protein [Prevotella sp.]MCI7341550.1 RelA/SpoT family protein [Prevotella sp.]MDY3272173.1 RelA/SpoT family protein [Prevotella sp.]OYP60251.1 GTP pyrophosphokinase [Prevotella sp. P3-122]OYP60322.1 GTP pyrophosphokinase [Prevotella sp. P3-122]